MTSIIPIPVETTMRRSLAGALATDPTLDERRRRVRRGRRAPQPEPPARRPDAGDRAGVLVASPARPR